MDKVRFHTTLTELLPKSRPTYTPEQIRTEMNQVNKALSQAIEDSVPYARPSKWSVSGFNEKGREAIQRARKLRRVWQRTRDLEDFEAFRLARNQKARILNRSMRDIHRQRVEQAAGDSAGLWKLAKWAKNRSSIETVTPAIRDKEGQLKHEPSDKVKLLKQTFFLKPPEADLSNMEGYSYPDPLETPIITEPEVRRAVRNANPNKASGSNGTPSLTLHWALENPGFLSIVTVLFNVCLNNGYCYDRFKESITITLKKPAKGDYSQPKAYRSIALLNTLGKALESIIAKRISYLAETFGLLPKTHIGGRRITSTEHAVHLILEKIYSAWGSKALIASMLSLDVAGAFDNVSHARLLHNLRKRRIFILIVR